MNSWFIFFWPKYLRVSKEQRNARERERGRWASIGWPEQQSLITRAAGGVCESSRAERQQQHQQKHRRTPTTRASVCVRVAAHTPSPPRRTDRSPFLPLLFILSSPPCRFFGGAASLFCASVPLKFVRFVPLQTIRVSLLLRFVFSIPVVCLFFLDVALFSAAFFFFGFTIFEFSSNGRLGTGRSERERERDNSCVCCCGRTNTRACRARTQTRTSPVNGGGAASVASTDLKNTKYAAPFVGCRLLCSKSLSIASCILVRLPECCPTVRLSQSNRRMFLLQLRTLQRIARKLRELEKNDILCVAAFAATHTHTQAQLNACPLFRLPSSRQKSYF